MTRFAQANIIGAYGLSWLKVYLEGDERYCQLLLRPFPSITTKKSAHNLKKENPTALDADRT